MDRFTHALRGTKEEVIERQSVESAATMKLPVTVDKCILNSCSYLLNDRYIANITICLAHYKIAFIKSIIIKVHHK